MCNRWQNILKIRYNPDDFSLRDWIKKKENTFVTARKTKKIILIKNLCPSVKKSTSRSSRSSQNYLQCESPFTGVFNKVGDGPRGEANNQRTTFGFFGMWAQQVGSQNILCKQRIAAVTVMSKRKPLMCQQQKEIYEWRWGLVRCTNVAIPAQHHTAWASASSVSAKLGARDLLAGVSSRSFSVSNIIRARNLS